MNTCFRVELPVSEYSRLVSEDSHDLYIEMATTLLLKVVDVGRSLFDAV